MTHIFGYMVLFRFGNYWGIDFMQGEGDTYPNAQREAYTAVESNQVAYAKAMSYSMISYPYDIHKALRFGDNPVTIDELVSFLHRYGFALDLNRSDIRQKEMFIKLKLKLKL
jgi:hypothetical protein